MIDVETAWLIVLLLTSVLGTVYVIFVEYAEELEDNRMEVIKLLLISFGITCGLFTIYKLFLVAIQVGFVGILSLIFLLQICIILWLTSNNKSATVLLKRISNGNLIPPIFPLSFLCIVVGICSSQNCATNLLAIITYLSLDIVLLQYISEKTEEFESKTQTELRELQTGLVEETSFLNSFDDKDEIIVTTLQTCEHKKSLVSLASEYLLPSVTEEDEAYESCVEVDREDSSSTYPSSSYHEEPSDEECHKEHEILYKEKIHLKESEPYYEPVLIFDLNRYDIDTGLKEYCCISTEKEYLYIQNDPEEDYDNMLSDNCDTVSGIKNNDEITCLSKKLPTQVERKEGSSTYLNISTQEQSLDELLQNENESWQKQVAVSDYEHLFVFNLKRFDIKTYLNENYYASAAKEHLAVQIPAVDICDNTLSDNPDTISEVKYNNGNIKTNDGMPQKIPVKVERVGSSSSYQSFSAHEEEPDEEFWKENESRHKETYQRESELNYEPLFFSTLKRWDIETGLNECCYSATSNGHLHIHVGPGDFCDIISSDNPDSISVNTTNDEIPYFLQRSPRMRLQLSEIYKNGIHTNEPEYEFGLNGNQVINSVSDSCITDSYYSDISNGFHELNSKHVTENDLSGEENNLFGNYTTFGTKSVFNNKVKGIVIKDQYTVKDPSLDVKIFVNEPQPNYKIIIPIRKH